MASQWTWGLRTWVSVVAAAILTLGVVAATQVPAATNPHKINVLGEWAHPDDDTSIIDACGVWHQRYGIRCGIIQATRGEGGGNAIGPETATALGLRRENEDRAAHYRSGTVDIFYLDRVDFYYNQSAPLTQSFWGHDETLRRVTRIIRETQPDIYFGFTPTLAAGHGNHQEAGRLIWEGVQAAADPRIFSDQLRGPNALTTWQVKKVISGGDTAGSGGSTTTANCTTGFVPAAGVLNPVGGVWTGYHSPYRWPAGNIQAVAAGTPKTWAQVSTEGMLAYPTQSRTMFTGIADPGCSRFGVTESFVPFQPDLNPDGTPNPQAGLDNALLFGASIPDPGGLPLGTQLYLTFSRFFTVAGEPFQVTVHARAGTALPGNASVALTVPPGWLVSAARDIGPLRSDREVRATFTVTPSASAPAKQYKISALLTDRAKSGYTDNVMQIVPAAVGRFQRWGNWGEYDKWVTKTAPSALRLGRSAAVQSIGVGESISVPVDVHNYSTVARSGQVSLTLPAGFSADATSRPYPNLAPGAEVTVPFTVTNTNTALASSTSYPVGIATSSVAAPSSGAAPPGFSSETLSLALVPTTTIPHASKDPVLDGVESPGEYTGPALDLSNLWQGDACNPAGIDCGTAPGAVPGDVNSSYAKVTWSNDNLYFFIHVRDNQQSYAATAQQCFAHWLTDSVEIQIDPRGNSSQTLADTSTTFKAGIFPFTDDPTNTLGNPTPNGPCWERDADNHQGYSNGPLAVRVPGAPNAPGMRVVSTAAWVGNNDPGQPHGYANGYYNLEVRIPMADLPAAIDPSHLGLNITSYDEDNQLHIDQSKRLAWSAFTSVQSDPYHWGHAYVQGYQPPPGRSSTPTAPRIPATALRGVDSPQTIFQSAMDGVPIAGLPPAPENDTLFVTGVSLSPSSVDFRISATGAGTAHFFLWSDDHSYIPVYTSSCANDLGEPGFTPCAAADGANPPWGTTMSGRLVGDMVVSVSPRIHDVAIPLDAAEYNALKAQGSALVSFLTSHNEVQASALPLRHGGIR